MSSVTTFAESVASCHTSPSPAAVAAPLPDARPLPVRRHLDFPGGGGNLDDNDEDFLSRAPGEMERNLHERRAALGLTPPPVALAPPTFPEKQCICGRGPCDVEWKEPGGWTYVCSAPPKCKHFSYCEQSDVNPNSQPAFWNHPEPNHPRVFDTRGIHITNATTQVNVSPQGTGATTPVTVNHQGTGARTPVNYSPQGAKSSGEVPTCKCTAGKCKTAKEKGVLYYVCHIPKGKGACSHHEPINAVAEELPLTGYNNPRETENLLYNPVMKEANGHNLVMMGGHNETRPCNLDEYDDWPFDIVEGDVVPTDCLSPAQPSSIVVVAQGSPVILQRPVGMVELETPTKSPMPPKYAISPMTPRSNGCYRCSEEGHFMLNCPKNNTCYNCHVAGHWVKDCPGLTKRS